MSRSSRTRRPLPRERDPVKEPPADILRRLRPIPTDRRRGPACDVEGVDPSGAPISVDVVGAAAPVLLLFLSAACVGCRDLWEGLSEFRTALAGASRVAVVTRSPEDEDVLAVARLAPLAASVADDGTLVVGSQVPVVMSTAAYVEYRVEGPPFFAVVGSAAVLGEGVAWGVDDTLRDVRAALVAPE
jgi:hypothetical protein